MTSKIKDENSEDQSCFWKGVWKLKKCLKECCVCHIIIKRWVWTCINKCKSGEKEHKIVMKKNLSNTNFTVKEDQFYFDADVIKLNKYLNGNNELIDKLLESTQESIKEKIPEERRVLFEKVWNEQFRNKTYLIKYLEWFLILNFVVYYT